MKRLRPSFGEFHKQSGVALAILVWYLAAMSILVASIVYQARIDIKLAQLHISRAELQAAGDGAIQLALADLLIAEQEGEPLGRGIFSGEYRVGNQTVHVRLASISGLVDLNSAPEELLSALFAHGGIVEEAVAQELAQNVLKWRSPLETGTTGLAKQAGAPEPRNGRFESLEDLLLIRGIDRQVFDRVKDSVYVAETGQAGVDWLSAPRSVLTVLGEGDTQLSQNVYQSREDSANTDFSTPAGLNSMFLEDQSLPVFRADATLVGADFKLLRRRWVNRLQPGGDGLPWSFFRTEPVTAINPQEGAALARTEKANVGS